MESRGRSLHCGALLSRRPQRQSKMQGGPAEGIWIGGRHAVAGGWHVSRFAAQKGFDLILQVANRLALQELIMVVLGSGGREYEELFRKLNKQYPQKFAVKIAYDSALAHKIEAGSDIF